VKEGLKPWRAHRQPEAAELRQPESVHRLQEELQVLRVLMLEDPGADLPLLRMTTRPIPGVVELL
jgi:hypothetical protein